jgi:hypothetical protein
MSRMVQSDVSGQLRIGAVLGRWTGGLHTCNAVHHAGRQSGGGAPWPLRQPQQHRCRRRDLHRLTPVLLSTCPKRRVFRSTELHNYRQALLTQQVGSSAPLGNRWTENG